MPTALVAPASRQTSGFHPLLKKQVLIHCVLRSAVYGCVAAAGQAEDYHAMLRLHEQADSHEEKERVARETSSTSSTYNLDVDQQVWSCCFLRQGPAVGGLAVQHWALRP